MVKNLLEIFREIPSLAQVASKRLIPSAVNSPRAAHPDSSASISSKPQHFADPTRTARSRACEEDDLWLSFSGIKAVTIAACPATG
jgi:hypothetical protein